MKTLELEYSLASASSSTLLNIVYLNSGFTSLNSLSIVLLSPTRTACIGCFLLIRFSLLYDEVSVKVGYEYLEGPGKVMGLAPYGKASKYYENLKSFIRFDDEDYPFRFVVPGKWRVKGGDFYEPYVFITNSLYLGGKVSWDPHGGLHPDAVDLAWAVQAVTEEAMLHLAKWAREHTGEDKLGLAGGVALNAKANMVIHYAKLFNDLFIFPAANDAGTPIGAAA